MYSDAQVGQSDPFQPADRPERIAVQFLSESGRRIQERERSTLLAHLQ
jgi:hypothetical protein